MTRWERITEMFFGTPKEKDPVPPELHEASHRQANEVQAFKASLFRIAHSDDPIGDLVRAMQKGGCRDGLPRCGPGDH